MLGIKKTLKILDPCNYRAAVRARGCLPERQEGKGREDMHHFFNRHGPIKGVLCCSWTLQQNPELRRDLRGSPWSSRVSPEAAAGYSKLSHKHHLPELVKGNQIRRGEWQQKPLRVILTDQQLLEQLLCAAVGNRPWGTPAFAPSIPSSSHGEKENNRF